MANANTPIPRHKLHSLEVFAFCGSREGLYTTFLYTTNSRAAVCEDPVRCLRRRHSQKVAV